ncbi:MAG: transposase [Treponema sp.]|jgi:putative transposase|nr:transposase [Treponema sp.]
MIRYKIAEFAFRLGIFAATVRRWERAGNLLYAAMQAYGYTRIQNLNRAHKVEFILNNEQRTLLNKHFGSALNAHVTSCEVIRHFGTSFKSFFTGKTKHPRFHTKKSGVEDNRSVENQDEVIGIDLGIKEMATCSDGPVIENPRISNRFASQLRRYNKRLAQRTQGSHRWWRTVYALRELHYSIACCRNGYIHKFTPAFTGQYGVIGSEDLNVQGMAQNHHLARSILDVSFYEIGRQLSYKAKELRLVGHFAPSSKTCSSCGHVKHDLTLKDRIYVCPDCGLAIDRDLNGAINISRWATPVPDVDKKALVCDTISVVSRGKLCLDEASSGLQCA